jgi:hypothetical protein
VFLVNACGSANKDAGDAMAAATRLLWERQIPCDVSDVRTIKQNGEMVDGAVASFYEVACKDSLGYVVVARDREPLVRVEDCVLAGQPGRDGNPNALTCKLPENADPNAALSKMMGKLGRICAVDHARGVGQTPRQDIVETSCRGGSGYILMLPIALGSASSANPCLGYDELNNPQTKCELTTPQQRDARLQTLASDSGKPCNIKRHHVIGGSPTGSQYTEVACDNGKGYVIETDASDRFKSEFDCAMAAGIGGGCTLTDTRTAQLEARGRYSGLARKAGFNCDVAKYANFTVKDPTTDVVELQCANRPDGGVGVFPASGPGRVLDCIRSRDEGYRCSLTKESDAYPLLLAQLKAKGELGCQVNGARAVGRTRAGHEFVEVSCSDGAPGWILDYPPMADTPTLLNCGQFASVGDGCQLPDNAKK